MIEYGFPKDFLWGTATASYQVEGAVHEGGRGKSIWDVFSHTPGCVLHGHTGDVASDQYHNYAEDVGIMRDLGIGAYRFSIAWPRVFPNGYGDLSSEGLDYYKRLLDALAEAGIEPAVTLYHWDLPQALEDEGGWPARDTALRFADYAATCFRELGDRVRFWITLNEPLCAAYLGYREGIHAPGIRDLGAAYRAVHHLNLAHGLAMRAFRDGGHEGRIGSTLNIDTPRPATRRQVDVDAADRAMDGPTRMFLDPLYGRGYPERHIGAYPEISLPVEKGDMEIIAVPVDFLGLNYYFEHAIAADDEHPEGFRRVKTGYPRQAMDWDMVPAGLYRQLSWVDANYDHPAIYITENGCACNDVLTPDGEGCHDPLRIEYLRTHLRAAGRALSEGVNLKGYFLWSFIDNFEWAFGYTKRLGIVYCDYTDGRRIVKDSGYYYREVVAGYEPV